MPPPPPFFLRMIPGLGLAVTGAYLGWKLYEYLQEQNVNAMEKLAGLETVTLVNDQESNIDRSQLCKWLGLPDDMLDYVPDLDLPIVLEALSLVPQAARASFIELYRINFNGPENGGAKVREWVEIFEQMSPEDEMIEKCVVIMTQIKHEAHLDALAKALKQISRQEPEISGNNEVSSQNISVGALSSPRRKISLFLNQLYVVWNLDAMEFFLEQFCNCDQTEGASSLKFLTDIMIRVTETGGANDFELFVKNWKRLVHSQGLSTDNELNGKGYLTSLDVALEQAESHTVSLSTPSSEQTNSSVVISSKDLLQKYNNLSLERFSQVTMCCAKFPRPQVVLLLQNLLSKGGSSSNVTIPSCSSSLSSSVTPSRKKQD